jgi:hypothetical protein
MKFIFVTSFVCLLSFGSFLPTVLGAGGLVTCDGVASAGVPCNFCTFAAMFEKVVNFVTAILIFIAVISLAVTGIQMAYIAAGNGDALSILKDRMTRIFLGFLLILASWTIVDTMVKVLVVDDSNTIDIIGWRKFMTSNSSELCGKPLVPQRDPDIEARLNSTGGYTNPDGTTIIPDLNNLKSLREAGVIVADWKGIDGPGRTDLAAPEVVQKALDMQNAAKAQYGKPIFQITAATTEGVGHSANSQHYKGNAIDLDPLPGFTTKQVEELAGKAGCTKVINHGSHIHCDFR